ncbi:MAG: hypothetical protein DUD39_18815, partial [Coriobacteriaceae bacterium]
LETRILLDIGFSGILSCVPKASPMEHAGAQRTPCLDKDIYVSFLRGCKPDMKAIAGSASLRLQLHA